VALASSYAVYRYTADRVRQCGDVAAVFVVI